MMFSIEFLGYLIIIFLGFVAGISGMKRRRSFVPIVILLEVTFICEFFSRIYAYCLENSNPVYHLLSPFQVLLIGAFFRMEFTTRGNKKVTFWLCTCLIVMSLLNSMFVQSIFKFPDNTLRVQSACFIALGFLLVAQKIDEPSKNNILKDPVFMVAVGVIWFNLISFIFFNFHQALVKNILSLDLMRIINYVSNYVFYLILLYSAIRMCREKSV